MGIFDTLAGKLNDTHDRLLLRATNKILDAVAPAILKAVEDPYAPWMIRRRVRLGFYKMWSLIAEELTRDVERKFAREHLALRNRRLDFWPSKPPLWRFGAPDYTFCEALAQLLRALRARFLYAEQPADGSSWKVLRDPLGVFITALKLSTYTSVMAFSMLFLLFDRRDEYQLVRFILKVKTTMFLVSGVIPLCMLGLKTHGCLEAIADGQPQRCVDDAASSGETFPVIFAFEVVRLLLVWAAFATLYRGQAFGGTGELTALEYARLDIADGAFDGKAPLAGRSASTRPERHVDRLPSVRAMRERIDAERARVGGAMTRRVGGVLPYFMAYDVGVLLCMLCLWVMLYAWPRPASLRARDPLFWSSLYNLKILYSLLMFPFFVFEMPIVDVSLHSAVPTAYDQTGRATPPAGGWSAPPCPCDWSAPPCPCD